MLIDLLSPLPGQAPVTGSIDRSVVRSPPLSLPVLTSVLSNTGVAGSSLVITSQTET